ncbi:MAG: glycosyl transferase, partial [Actinoplanes sp.]
MVVVGSGWRFLSGISYYTCRLSNALEQRYAVGAILMRQLLPTRLYPGRDRVGQRLSDLSYA